MTYGKVVTIPSLDLINIQKALDEITQYFEDLASQQNITCTTEKLFLGIRRNIEGHYDLKISARHLHAFLPD